MSDLGDDINEIHTENGNSFDLIRAGQSVSSDEYCIIKLNRQVTKPFIREFFLEAKFNWDTETLAGDVVALDDGRNYMVMNLSPIMFQNEVIEYTATLYKCNVSGEIVRPSGEYWDDDYRALETYPVHASTVYALQTEALYGNDMDTENELGALGLENHELYIPSGYGIRILDRYRPVSGEYYKVETINKRRYDNVWVCELTEDTR